MSFLLDMGEPMIVSNHTTRQVTNLVTSPVGQVVLSPMPTRHWRKVDLPEVIWHAQPPVI